MLLGTCPSCEKAAGVRYRAGSAREHAGSGQILVVTYTCGGCGAILGVQADPIALMTDQTNRIGKLLRK